MSSTTAVAQESRVIAGQTRTIDQLELSPFNCRTDRPTPENTAPLEARILIEGLRFPLEIHALRGRKDKWGVVAGRRRHRSIANLIERGDWPRGAAIPVIVHEGLSDAELIELSINENLRDDLQEHDLYRGVARAAALGHDVDRIARALGNQDVEKVAKWLRLGSLAKPIFAALADGTIDVARATAYAATEDLKLQTLVFEEMTSLATGIGGHPMPAQIRAALKVGDVELDRLLRFVGPEAYRAAGGRYELDLFADEPGQRGRVVDEGVLRTLVEAELETWRRDVRGRCGRDVRFIAKRPDNGVGGVDWLLQVTPKQDGPDGPILLPDGNIAAHIAITDDGADVTWWWASRAAKHGVRPAERASTPTSAPRTEPTAAASRGVKGAAAIGQQYDSSRQLADLSLREEDGLTADGVVAFRSLRRAGVRAFLIEDADYGGDVALDYLVYSQFRLLTGEFMKEVRDADIGMRRISAENTVGLHEAFAKAQPLVDASPAGRAFKQMRDQLAGRPWATDPDLVAGFRNYRAEAPLVRRHTAAIVAGIALERSLNADGYRVPMHDAIGAAMDEQRLRTLLPPTADQLNLMPARDRLAIAEPYVEAATFAAWSRMKSDEITGAVLQVLQGTHPAIRKAMKQAALRWVHPLLRFVAAGDAPATAAAAAEPRELEPVE